MRRRVELALLPPVTSSLFLSLPDVFERERSMHVCPHHACNSFFNLDYNCAVPYERLTSRCSETSVLLVSSVLVKQTKSVCYYKIYLIIHKVVYWKAWHWQTFISLVCYSWWLRLKVVSQVFKGNKRNSAENGAKRRGNLPCNDM